MKLIDWDILNFVGSACSSHLKTEDWEKSKPNIM